MSSAAIKIINQETKQYTSSHMMASAARSYQMSNFLTPSLMQICFLSFLLISCCIWPVTMSSSLLTYPKPSISTTVFSPLALVPLMVGSRTNGIDPSLSLLCIISLETSTAVSVASCMSPRCRILSKYLRTGAGLSRGGCPPRIPPKMSVAQVQSGLSSFSPRRSSMQTGSARFCSCTSSVTLSLTRVHRPGPAASNYFCSMARFFSLSALYWPWQLQMTLALVIARTQLESLMYSFICRYSCMHHSNRQSSMCSTMMRTC